MSLIFPPPNGLSTNENMYLPQKLSLSVRVILKKWWSVRGIALIMPRLSSNSRLTSKFQNRNQHLNRIEDNLYEKNGILFQKFSKIQVTQLETDKHNTFNDARENKILSNLYIKPTWPAGVWAEVNVMFL